ncbi:MAG: toxin-antitoxin system YwqK family antitoxin [Ilumatobacteraceae bacterium]|jgi:hypothetical protein
MELLPNSMSFRVINTIDITDDDEIPADFTGRVRRSFETAQRYVAWYTGGLLDDPTKGYPAYRVHRANGHVKYEMHYRNGVLDDPDPHTPAVRGYYADGAVHYEERYCAGRRHDGPGGVAAVRKWRADGTLRHELHYRHGSRLS